MREYDVIVAGTGRGFSVIRSAAGAGLRVAVAEMASPGGTCLNLGCIPSKLLIAVADRVREIQEAADFGIKASIEGIDFGAAMEFMRAYVTKYREERRRYLEGEDLIDFYPSTAEFISDRTLQAGGEEIKSDLIFVATGARPSIPPIEGLKEIPYLTNESVLELGDLPASLIIIGGGYIGVEYGHFFSAMGVEVTIVDIGDRLVRNEEPEISELLKERLSRHMQIRTGVEPVRVTGQPGSYTLVCRCTGDEPEIQLEAQAIMVATGRKPNSDLLKVDRAGIRTDKRGFVEVNDYYQTSDPRIWAFGDVIGKGMFTHAGNREADLAWANAHEGKKDTLDYTSIPHAVFTRPQIASVGMKQEEASANHDILVGKAEYSDTVKGAALHQQKTFAKAVVDAKSRRLLGFHIIGPYAPLLLQEATNVLASQGTVDDLTAGMHIHPAMSELIPAVVWNLEKPR